MADFRWVSKKPLDEIATIYDANITLNKSATAYFENAYAVQLGLNRDKKLVAVKPLTKEQVGMGFVPEEQRHNITVKSSYSRVCNKRFIKDIADLMNLDFERKQSYKFKAHWDESEDALIIDLKDSEV